MEAPSSSRNYPPSEDSNTLSQTQKSPSKASSSSRYQPTSTQNLPTLNDSPTQPQPGRPQKATSSQSSSVRYDNLHHHRQQQAKQTQSQPPPSQQQQQKQPSHDNNRSQTPTKLGEQQRVRKSSTSSSHHEYDSAYPGGGGGGGNNQRSPGDHPPVHHYVYELAGVRTERELAHEHRLDRSHPYSRSNHNTEIVVDSRLNSRQSHPSSASKKTVAEKMIKQAGFAQPHRIPKTVQEHHIHPHRGGPPVSDTEEVTAVGNQRRPRIVVYVKNHEREKAMNPLSQIKNENLEDIHSSGEVHVPLPRSGSISRKGEGKFAMPGGPHRHYQKRHPAHPHSLMNKQQSPGGGGSTQHGRQLTTITDDLNNLPTDVPKNGGGGNKSPPNINGKGTGGGQKLQQQTSLTGISDGGLDGLDDLTKMFSEGLNPATGAYDMQEMLDLPLFNDPTPGITIKTNDQVPPAPPPPPLPMSMSVDTVDITALPTLVDSQGQPHTTMLEQPQTNNPPPLPPVSVQVDYDFGDQTQWPFSCILKAPTSPITKKFEETLTYLNQGQSYEVNMSRLKNPEDICGIKGLPVTWSFFVVMRVVFHERRLQFSSSQYWHNWQNCHGQGDRVLKIDVPVCVNVDHPQHSSHELNAATFVWDSTKPANVHLQIQCISTEFTAKGRGGERGVPFRLHIDMYPHYQQDDIVTVDFSQRLLFSSSCQIKVFKPKGADRKLKTDCSRVDKKSAQEKTKFRPSKLYTSLVQCNPLNDQRGGIVLPPGMDDEFNGRSQQPPPPAGINRYGNQTPAGYSNVSDIKLEKQLTSYSMEDVRVDSHNHSPNSISSNHTQRVTMSAEHHMNQVGAISSSINDLIPGGGGGGGSGVVSLGGQLGGSSASIPGTSSVPPALSVTNRAGSGVGGTGSVDANDYRSLRNNESFDDLPTIEQQQQQHTPPNIRNSKNSESPGGPHQNNSTPDLTAHSEIMLRRPPPDQVANINNQQQPQQQQQQQQTQQHAGAVGPHNEHAIFETIFNNVNEQVNQQSAQLDLGYGSGQGQLMVGPGGGVVEGFHHTPPPPQQNDLGIAKNDITPNFNCHQVQHWLRRKNFSIRCQENLKGFNGEDILRLSKSDLVEILGSPKDGIRLFNALQRKPILPRKTIYISFYLPPHIQPLQDTVLINDYYPHNSPTNSSDTNNTNTPSNTSEHDNDQQGGVGPGGGTAGSSGQHYSFCPIILTQSSLLDELCFNILKSARQTVAHDPTHPVHQAAVIEQMFLMKKAFRDVFIRLDDNFISQMIDHSFFYVNFTHGSMPGSFKVILHNMTHST